MSVIAAIKENGKVYVGSDSQTTRGGSRQSLKNPNNYKIWKVRNSDNCLMAYCGDTRDACAIRVQGDIVDEYMASLGAIDYTYVVKSIIPNLIASLRQFGYLTDSTLTGGMESAYLFIYQDKIFYINYDFSVLEIDDYIAIGSGSCEAIGSLLTTEGEDPRVRLIKAIKASAASDIYVDYPIVLSDTENTEFEIITKDNEKEYLTK